MSFFGGLLKVGITAGAVFAAMKVADKYKANNPDGVTDTNEKISEITRAAKEVYGDAAESVKEKAPEVKEKISETVQMVSDYASEKIPGVTAAVQNVVEKIAEKAPEVNERFHEAVEKVSEKVIIFAEAVAEDDQEKAESEFEDVVDAEVVSFEENSENEPKE